MIGMYAIIAVALIAGGVALGIVIVITVGIRQEEKVGTLTVDSPSRVATGGRALMAATSRRPGISYQVKAQRENLADAA
jgi:hypothetical protein